MVQEFPFALFVMQLLREAHTVTHSYVWVP